MSDPTKDSTIAVPKGLKADPGQSFDPGKSMMRWLLDHEKDNLYAARGSVELNEWLDSLQGTEEESDSIASGSVGSTVSPYQLHFVIGEGGFGAVWKANQTSLGRVVAVKKLKDDYSKRKKNATFIARHMELSFRHEALTTGALEHPNIVPVYDLGLDESGRPMIAMKMVRGDQWDDVIEKDFTSIPVAEFLAKHLPILIDVAQAVAFAHSRGVVHRDVKPSQVMLGEFGEVLLMDWGLALVYDLELARNQGSRLDQTEFTTWSKRATSPAGTPSFMAPEQTLETTINVGPWTDVYQLGGCLYFLLVGAGPHEQPTGEETFRHAAECAVPNPTKRNKEREIPEELSQLAMRALSQDRKKRPTAKEMIEGISDYLTGASKRREAQAIVTGLRSISERSWKDFTEYGELTDTLVQLDQALILAPRHIEAMQLRQDVLIQFARIAMSSKDYKLARVQAERLEHSPERHMLIEEITHLEQKQTQEQKRLEQSIRHAKVLSDEAGAAQREMEALLAGTLKAIMNDKDAMASSGIAVSTAQRCMAFYRDHATKQSAGPGIKDRIEALISIAQIYRSRAMSKEALEALKLAEDLLQAQAARDIGPSVEALSMIIKNMILQVLTGMQKRESNASVDTSAFDWRGRE